MSFLKKVKAFFSKAEKDSGKIDAAALLALEDLPNTVSPFDENGLGRRKREVLKGTESAYIWRSADLFVQEWLPRKGYQLRRSAIFDDCIGYRCERKGEPYTVFLYAWGEKQTARLNGEYCSKLADLPFAEGSTVLILWVKVDRKEENGKVDYPVRDYRGSGKREPQLWRLGEMEGRPILELFLSKEAAEGVGQFMYAFNREDADSYDCLLSDELPTLTYEGEKAEGAEFFAALKDLRRRYGDVKLGYVRNDDSVWSAVPCLEGAGFFSWRVYTETGRIFDLELHPFQGGRYGIIETVITREREGEAPFGVIPALTAVEPLEIVPTERFAAKVFFQNGECRKFVLAEKAAEALGLTDDLWATATAAPRHKSPAEGYGEGGSAMVFANGAYAAAPRCYLHSAPYSEPVLTDEVLFDDGAYRIRKLWQWDVEAMRRDEETHDILWATVGRDPLTGREKATPVTVEGKRLTTLAFDDHDNFREGVARVGIQGCGYGFVDRDMRFTVPMRYDSAENFQTELAKVRRGSETFYVNKSGQELRLPYARVDRSDEGLCAVSTVDIDWRDLAFHWDYCHDAGIWGFINEAGEEVIPPQYLCVSGFEDGLCLAVKGRWERRESWYGKGRENSLWTETELWGAIDKTGREAIPFLFDEIKCFFDRTDLFMAHFGGWKEGRWGLIDREGKWLAEPTFHAFDYETFGDLVIFYGDDPDAMDDAPMGVYSIKEKRVVVPAEYDCISFGPNGDILVEFVCPDTFRRTAAILDPQGRERFASPYTGIDRVWNGEVYIAALWSEEERRCGIIDAAGRVLVPCDYDIPYGGVFTRQKLFCFKENDKTGVRDFGGNPVLDPVYDAISLAGGGFLLATKGGETGLFTLRGDTVFPVGQYGIEPAWDNRHFLLCGKDGFTVCAVEKA